MLGRCVISSVPKSVVRKSEEVLGTTGESMWRMIRKTLRGWALDGLTVYYRWSGYIPPPAVPRVQMLYLHYVYDEQVDRFEELLAWIRGHYTIVSYSEAVERIQKGQIDSPYAALSFDDGLRESCLNAARILHSQGLSACFFVCPGIVGESDPDRLRDYFKRISHAPTEILDWADVEKLLEWGQEIGSHTHTHRKLSELGRERAKEELERSRDALDRVGVDPVHFSWPYGRFHHIDRSSVELVHAMDYASAASAERGCHVTEVNGPAELCLRRDHVDLNWPLEHNKFFLARNAARPAFQRNDWPGELRPRNHDGERPAA